MSIWKNLLGLFALGVASSVMVTACSDSSDAQQQTGDQSAKYAGLYFLGKETFSLNIDGTQTTVQANMFNVGGGARVGPAQGVWREIGENRIVVTNIRFRTDSSGNEFGPGGWISKTTFELIFDDPIDGRSPGFVVEENYLTELFYTDQNPVTDEPFASSTLPGGARGYRITAGPSGS